MSRSRHGDGRTPGPGVIWWIAIAALLGLTGAAVTTFAQQRVAPSSREAARPGIRGVLPVQGNVSVVVTTEGNVTVQAGPDGVLLVDAATAGTAEALLLAVRGLTTQPIRWIVNTHVHPDHTGGNEAVSKGGQAPPMGAVAAREYPGRTPTKAIIVAHENVLRRMSAPTGEVAPTPLDAWPGDTYFGAEKEMYLNGEPIAILHQARAHTDGDSLVFFRKSDVVSTGDVYVTTSYPVIDVAAGGTINGTIAALNRVLDLTVAREKAEGGTYVIPGHGRVSDEADVVLYRNMVTIVRDRVEDLRKRGMSLEQIKAARPTREYDRRWATASWTADAFVDAIHRTLPVTATAQR